MTLDATGLTTPRLADIREAIRADIAANPDLGPSVQTGPDTVIGQLIDIFGQQLAEMYGTIQAAYDALRPDDAEGDALDQICAYAGVIRLAASHSTVTLTASGTPATVIPPGSIARVPGGVRFVTTAEGVIGGGGTVAIPARAEVTGPVEAGAGTITGIVTTITGWASVTNAAAATPGRSVETDAELRVRRELSLQRASASTDQALRARLLEVPDVQAAVVLSNRTDVTDGYSIPPHSFRAIVWPDLPDDPAIFEAIWGQTPMGIQSNGLYAGLVTDSQGVSQTVRYSPASAQEVHVVVRVVIDDDLYPLDGDDQIEAAVLAYASALSIGDDFRPFRIIGAIEEIPGILDLEVRAKIGSTPGASDTVTIPIAITQIATVDAGDITVTQVPSI